MRRRDGWGVTRTPREEGPVPVVYRRRTSSARLALEGHWSAYAVALHRKRPSNVPQISDDAVVPTMFRFQRSARTRRRVVASRSRMPSQERPPKKPQRDKWNFRKTVKVRSMHIACGQLKERPLKSQVVVGKHHKPSCCRQTPCAEIQTTENTGLFMTPRNLHRGMSQLKHFRHKGWVWNLLYQVKAKNWNMRMLNQTMKLIHLHVSHCAKHVAIKDCVTLTLKKKSNKQY